jgi:hypothetical protein
MPIVVRCHDCGALLKFRDDALGKKAKCSKCSGVMHVLPAGKTRKTGDDDAVFQDNLASAPATPVSKRELGPVSHSRPAASPVETSPMPEEDLALATTRLGARLPVRIIALALLLTPIPFASRLSLPERLASCIVPLILAGTYRVSTIGVDRFTTSFHFAFVPIATHHCNLRGVTSIKARFAWDGPGWGTIFVFGASVAAIGWLFEFLIPAIGGPYQIHLVTAKGRELVAWQGFVDSQFKTTLDLLVRLTNAEVRSM